VRGWRCHVNPEQLARLHCSAARSVGSESLLWCMLEDVLGWGVGPGFDDDI
jgi:hypothetical protein